MAYQRLPKGLSLIETDQVILAKLYDTLILRYEKPEKRLVLNHGGWMTKHTKKCMNLILHKLGYAVKQKNGDWYLTTESSNYAQAVGFFASNEWEGVL